MVRMNPEPSDEVDRILELFREHGNSQYGFEAVSQLEHSLQTATLALEAGAGESLVAAALLHDIGHLLHDLPDDTPDQGIDDCHEEMGGNWLAGRFSDEVVAAVRLHVPAKRYLCAVDSFYHDQLSDPSRQSLALQGGPMDSAEVARFKAHPFHQESVQLRRWDDLAKDPDAITPALELFRPHLAAALK